MLLSQWVLLYHYFHQLQIDRAAAPWFWQQDLVLLLMCQCCLQVACWQLQSIELFVYCNKLPARLQVNYNPLCLSSQVKWYTKGHLLLFLLLWRTACELHLLPTALSLHSHAEKKAAWKQLYGGERTFAAIGAKKSRHHQGMLRIFETVAWRPVAASHQCAILRKDPL
jgi:hypothetical protein